MRYGVRLRHPASVLGPESALGLLPSPTLSSAQAERRTDIQDRQLYAQILGIADPWYVERVELKLDKGEVHVFPNHSVGIQWPCPECSTLCNLCDHQPSRTRRHLDACQYQTILHADPPRSDCREHGPRVVKQPWAEQRSLFTMLFERLATDWLRAASQKAVVTHLGLSWDEIHGIMDQAVERGLARREAEPLKYIGVDEKAFRKGHGYTTIVKDLQRSRVLYVAEERKESSLDGFWQTLTEERKNGIDGVAVDMCDPYISSVCNHPPDADQKIVFDKYHIARHLGDSVDHVNRQERNKPVVQGYEPLVSTKYLWLRNPADFTHPAWEAFKSLSESTLKMARAWALRESATSLMGFRNKQNFKTAIYFHCGGLDMAPSPT